MPSSRPEKPVSKKRRPVEEPHDINQLGLDFLLSVEYSTPPRKETKLMNQELIEVLENRITEIVEKYSALKKENVGLNEEIQRLTSEREGLKSRVDAIIGKLEGI